MLLCSVIYIDSILMRGWKMGGLKNWDYICDVHLFPLILPMQVVIKFSTIPIM